jgi:acyl-coenzyme A synthetase/AMP-(fatty) acid ligase
MPPGDAPVSEQELRDHLAQLLPTHKATHKVPYRIVQLETLPRRSTGKSLRSTLPQRV